MTPIAGSHKSGSRDAAGLGNRSAAVHENHRSRIALDRRRATRQAAIMIGQAVILCGGCGARPGAAAVPTPLLVVDGAPWLDINLLDIATRLSRHPSALGVLALRQVSDIAHDGAVTLAGEQIVGRGSKRDQLSAGGIG